MLLTANVTLLNQFENVFAVGSGFPLAMQFAGYPVTHCLTLSVDCLNGRE